MMSEKKQRVLFQQDDDESFDDEISSETSVDDVDDNDSHDGEHDSEKETEEEEKDKSEDENKNDANDGDSENETDTADFFSLKEDQQIERVLTRKIDINTAGIAMYAVQNARYKLLSYLIEEKADINQASLGSAYVYPLLLAAISAPVDVICTLMNAGASMDSRSRDGSTVVHESLDHPAICRTKWGDPSQEIASSHFEELQTFFYPKAIHLLFETNRKKQLPLHVAIHKDMKFAKEYFRNEMLLARQILFDSVDKHIPIKDLTNMVLAYFFDFSTLSDPVANQLTRFRQLYFPTSSSSSSPSFCSVHSSLLNLKKKK